MPKKPRTPPAVPSSPVVREVLEIGAGAFKNGCLHLLDRVHNHDLEVVVTKRGEPVARVVPPDSTTTSAFGFLRGTLLAQGDIIAPDFTVWGDLR